MTRHSEQEAAVPRCKVCEQPWKVGESMVPTPRGAVHVDCANHLDRFNIGFDRKQKAY